MRACLLTLWHILEYREVLGVGLNISECNRALLNLWSRASVIHLMKPAGFPLSTARHPRSLSS